MKRNSINFFLMAALSASCLTGTNAFAITPTQADALRTALQAVSVTEMPAKASELVSAATAGDRQDAAQIVVRTAVERKATIAASLVGAVAKGTPEVSGIAAVTAALIQPKQIGPITKAAVTGAPAQAADIVAAMCKQFPSRYNLIAMAAYEAAPQAGVAILSAVAANVPFVKPVIERAMAAGGTSVNVAGVISETEQFVITAAKTLGTTADNVIASTETSGVATAALAAPTPGGPFQPVSPTPVIINSGNTSVVAPGGSRDY